MQVACSSSGASGIPDKDTHMTRETLRKLVADPVVRAYTAISGSDVAEHALDVHR